MTVDPRDPGQGSLAGRPHDPAPSRATSDGPELHEQLCAYLLDECTPEQRAEVERLLSADPSLAEERARLEGTIDLVRGSIGLDGAGDASDRLSEAALARLRAAASSAGGAALAPDPWRTSTLRAAAALLLVVGSYAAFRLAVDPRQGSGGTLDDLARAEVPPSADATPGRATVGSSTRNADRNGAEALRSEVAGAPSTPGAPGPPKEGVEFDREEGETTFGFALTDGFEARARGSEAPDPSSQELHDRTLAETESVLGCLEVRDELNALGYAGGATGLRSLESLDLLEDLSRWEEVSGRTADARALELGTKRSARLKAGEDDLGLYVFSELGRQQDAGEAEVRRLADAGIPVHLARGAYEDATVAHLEELREQSRASDTGGEVASGADDFFLGQGVTGSAPAQDGEAAPSGEEAGGGPVADAGAEAANDPKTRPVGTPAAEPVDGPLDGPQGPPGVAAADDPHGAADEGRGRRVPVGVDLPEAEASEAEVVTEELAVDEDQAAVRIDADLLADLVLEDVRPRPGESPSAMYFRFWGDNAWEQARLDPWSTFGVDVDTNSYTLARAYLEGGYLPTKQQIRTEEFLNYFDAGVAAPADDTFDLDLELAPSPFAQDPGTWLLRVVVAGEVVPLPERPPLQLTFVVDESGSMKEDQRIDLVRYGLMQLVEQLDVRDNLAIVAFDGEARLALPMTNAANQGDILAAVDGLQPDGSTNAGAGLELGYQHAADNFRRDGGVNRVVLLSDGVANTGETDQANILASVADYKSQGIYLNTIGVGMDNHDDAFLEQLADDGDGISAYVDDVDEADKHLVEDFVTTTVPIARDAKIQVEFDANQVEAYRLLGYENRAIADADFRDDAVDAGELNSGHQVTALYEVTRLSTAADPATPLAVARLRWKAPFEAAAPDEVVEIEAGIGAREASGSFEGTTLGFQRSALVAQFAELLRQSSHAEGDTYEDLFARARALAPALQDPHFDELVLLVQAAQALDAAAPDTTGDASGELAGALEELRALTWREAVEERLAQDGEGKFRTGGLGGGAPQPRAGGREPLPEADADDALLEGALDDVAADTSTVEDPARANGAAPSPERAALESRVRDLIRQEVGAQ